ncbi:SepM family pheromone-processing serine protease [Jeotgalibacillus soli]|uniref:endopeptidase La n=1 Tax=Jeotgalibacillus soli TaxID=889306 RepID=A0A0C2R3D2_9BACL|nr:SepM family pheromone-processing serine protease [Jeotgalibacillus soli]KIL44775.1 hypothetical protein KP78_23190 [Jeotgalibacillus soli]
MKNKLWFTILLAFTILLLFASFYTLPYYVQKPGNAFVLDDIVEVENGTESEGDFSLMTVSQIKANVFSYLWALMDEYQIIYPVDQVRAPHESEDEYSVRQLYLMDNSAQQAIEVAYKQAGADLSYEYNGIYVLNIYPGMPAEKILKAGDRITSIDEHIFQSSEEFIDYVGGKKKGDSITVTIERDNQVFDENLTLQSFPDNPEQIGLGISLVDDRNVQSDPQVLIDSSGIGGPSAGLMYSLEIYDQLIPEDLTKGYNIAGTGTISSDGEVGRIGGIEQKVIAADRQGIEIFLAPDDTIPEDVAAEDPDAVSNYRAAVKTAEEIGTDMQIIPVKTFEDALKYLLLLEKKSSS